MDFRLVAFISALILMMIALVYIAVPTRSRLADPPSTALLTPATGPAAPALSGRSPEAA
jgi:hypothetical protein